MSLLLHFLLYSSFFLLADANGLATFNETYNPEIIQNEAEEPTYENMAGAQTDANSYDNIERKGSGAAMYGNVEHIVPSSPDPGVYESVEAKPVFDESNPYECLRKESNTDTALYTGLQYGNTGNTTTTSTPKKLTKESAKGRTSAGASSRLH